MTSTRNRIVFAFSTAFSILSSAGVVTLMGGLGLGATAVTMTSMTLPGCSTDPPDEIDRQEVLRDVTSKVILPTYADLLATTAALSTAADALAASPDAAKLKATQAAWRAARTPWRQGDAFYLGPVFTGGFDSYIDFWPVNPSDLDAIIDGHDVIDAPYAALLGANKKGFYALEILLFDNEAGDDAVLASLTGDENARRRDLLSALGKDLATQAKGLSDAWDPSKGNFAKDFAEAGKSGTNAKFDTQKKAFDALVNASLRASELVVSVGLAEPIGRNGAPPDVSKLRASRSDNSQQDLLDTLTGVQSVYLCTRGSEKGKSLSDVVREKTAPIDDAARKHIDDAIAAVKAVPPPIRTALTSDLSALKTAYTQSNDLKRSLNTEVASVLGVMPTFNDTDGD